MTETLVRGCPACRDLPAAEAAFCSECGQQPLLMRAVRGFCLVVVIAVWSVVGILFWIPLLARTLGIYVASILFSTILNHHHTSIASQQRRVDNAITFYSRGFATVAARFSHPELSSVETDKESPGETISRVALEIVIVLVETTWMTAFWTGIAWLALRLTGFVISAGGRQFG